eukprot:scaffold2090_cov225-Prasinococcus_capsulatus_cf.AAC.23
MWAASYHLDEATCGRREAAQDASARGRADCHRLSRAAVRKAFGYGNGYDYSHYSVQLAASHSLHNTRHQRQRATLLQLFLRLQRLVVAGRTCGAQLLLGGDERVGDVVVFAEHGQVRDDVDGRDVARQHTQPLHSTRTEPSAADTHNGHAAGGGCAYVTARVASHLVVLADRLDHLLHAALELLRLRGCKRTHNPLSSCDPGLAPHPT